MSELSQMIRWNTKFVRGLAQSVLERARVIRHGLNMAAAEAGAVSQEKKTAPKPRKESKRKKQKRGTKVSKRRG